jgi:hypothetical protein
MKKRIRAGNIVGKQLETLVHEEHQRTVQLEKQVGILSGK